MVFFAGASFLVLVQQFGALWEILNHAVNSVKPLFTLIPCLLGKWGSSRTTGIWSRTRTEETRACWAYRTPWTASCWANGAKNAG